MSLSTRYTAVVEVHEIKEDSGTGRGDDKTWKKEIARIVVRADSLEKLQAKLSAHVALIEEN